jgi:hypothetical protein
VKLSIFITLGQSEWHHASSYVSLIPVPNRSLLVTIIDRKICSPNEPFGLHVVQAGLCPTVFFYIREAPTRMFHHQSNTFKAVLMVFEEGPLFGKRDIIVHTSSAEANLSIDLFQLTNRRAASLHSKFIIDWNRRLSLSFAGIHFRHV